MSDMSDMSQGLQIGLPPVLNFGSDEMKKRVATSLVHLPTQCPHRGVSLIGFHSGFTFLGDSSIPPWVFSIFAGGFDSIRPSFHSILEQLHLSHLGLSAL